MLCLYSTQMQQGLTMLSHLKPAHERHSSSPMVRDLHLDVVGVGVLEGVHKGCRPDSALHRVPLYGPAPVPRNLLIQVASLALGAQVGHQHILGRQGDWISCTAYSQVRHRHGSPAHALVAV